MRGEERKRPEGRLERRSQKERAERKKNVEFVKSLKKVKFFFFFSSSSNQRKTLFCSGIKKEKIFSRQNVFSCLRRKFTLKISLNGFEATNREDNFIASPSSRAKHLTFPTFHSF